MGSADDAVIDLGESPRPPAGGAPRRTGGDVVIDLGEPPDFGDDDWDRPRRSRDPHRYRPWLLLAAAGLMIATVTSSAHPVPGPSWRELVTVPLRTIDSQVFVVRDQVLTHDLGRGTVTAYRTADGELSWRSELPLREIFGVAEVGGVLVFSGSVIAPEDDQVPRTFAVEPGTGTVRWSVPGAALPGAATEDRVVVVSPGETTFAATGVSPLDGGARWRYEWDGNQFSLSTVDWGYLAGPDAAAFDEALLWGPDGVLLALPFTTGRAARIGELPPGASVLDFDARTVVVELSADQAPDGATVYVAYDRATMAELWRRAADPAVAFTLTRCGDLLCATDTRSTDALDPRSGRTVWTSQAAPYAKLRRSGGDLVLAELASPDGTKVTQLLDARTGAVWLSLGAWRVLGTADGEVLTIQPAGTGLTAGAWLGRITATGRPSVRPLRMLGPPGARSDSCDLLHGLLICRGLAELTLMRVS